MTAPAPIAAIVLNYNGRPWLDDCLRSLQAQTTPVEVVVADNASTDDSLAHLRAHWPAVRVLAFDRNWGFAEGYNRAIAAVEAEWVIMVNNDAMLAPDWTAHLLAGAAAHPRAAVLGGKLLLHGPGVAGRILQSVGARFTDAGTAFEVGWGQPDTGQFAAPHRTASIPGAALLIRRAVFQALGGFDGDYFAYLEDVDLCWRAWLAGQEVWAIPAAEAWHRFGATSGGRASAFRIRQMQRNRYANMVKLLSPGMLVRGLVTSLGYDLYRVLEFAAHGRWANLGALGAGLWAATRALPALWRQRQVIQRARQVSDRFLEAEGLLVSAGAAFREYRRLARVAPNY